MAVKGRGGRKGLANQNVPSSILGRETSVVPVLGSTVAHEVDKTGVCQHTQKEVGRAKYP